MEEVEIARELIEFLNDTGQYRIFLTWAEERGYDPDKLDEDLMNIEENF